MVCARISACTECLPRISGSNVVGQMNARSHWHYCYHLSICLQFIQKFIIKIQLQIIFRFSSQYIRPKYPNKTKSSSCQLLYVQHECARNRRISELPTEIYTNENRAESFVICIIHPSACYHWSCISVFVTDLTPTEVSPYIVSVRTIVL